MLETEADRAFMVGQLGDVAHVGTSVVHGAYDEPSAEAIGFEGAGPTFFAARGALTDAGVSADVAGGTTIDRVVTHDARVRGPFVVVRYTIQDDGAFVELGLALP